MFRLSSPKDETNPPTNQALSRNKRSVRTLDERFIRILKIFKWGPDAEKALEVLMLKVDHRLVREVLKIDIEINVKIQFFKWAGKRRNFEHDSTTYMALIHCLDEAGLVGEMWKTIQDMVRSTCLMGPADLSEIVKILGKAKMVNKALSIFYHIKGRKCKPTASTYNSIILMLMQEGHHEKVHELYNEMCNESNCFPNTVTYSALISAFGKLGRDDSAIRLSDEMRENGLHPTEKIYTTLLGIHFKLGRVEKALGLFQEMKDKGCLPTVYTYTELIKGLGKAGRVEEGYSMFLNMLKEGCKPDVVVINNVINFLGRAGRLADALKLFEQMESLHCTPNVVTYNTVIKSLFENKAPTSEASSWFDRMRTNGVVPSSFTYSILIDGFCKTNRVEKALLLLEEMDEKGFPPCPAAYCSLINTLGKAKRYEAANELFQELRENCGSSTARVYAVMIKHFGKCGRLTEALDLFNEMKKLGSSPDVYAYNALMSGMVRAGMIDEAHSLLRTMEENGCSPDINSHNIILNGLARTGGPQRAIEMFAKMKHSNIKPDAVSYNTVLGCLSRAGIVKEDLVYWRSVAVSNTLLSPSQTARHTVMLRKSDRSHYANLDMGNVITHPAASKSYRSSVHQRRHEISSSFGGTLNLYSVGSSTKVLSNSASVFRTPTPLEFRVFSFPSNPSAFRSSESSPSQKGPQERWDCTEVGLGMINSLMDENERCDHQVFNSPKSKNIIFGTQLKINFPKEASSSHFYTSLNSSVEANQPLPGNNMILPQYFCGSYVVNSLDHVPFDDLSSYLVDSIRINSSSLTEESSLVSKTNGTNHTIPDSLITLSDHDEMENSSVNSPSFVSSTNGTNHTIPGSLSLSELELSEEYTRIVSYGPDQKITHIFGDSILEYVHPIEKKKMVISESSQMANNPQSSTSSYPFDDEFLIFCYTCKKILEKGKDIYIYRGDRSFCSYECRFEEILAEQIQKNVKKSSKSNPISSNQEVVFLI
ncbi:hypothetical protein F0562_024655 [Nyssa sinensis]|uniref:FLZ-type domain-containing protein n=1 Tax=Nyssa sinensis TaxID=561372 RepID=A0A5J5BD35_9ASTE|nr:hypothetical protein F0562_024655 [Nyssa sinensis]